MSVFIDPVLFSRADQYRHEWVLSGGVVIFFRGEIQGWCNELRNPESWVPDCIAVSVDYQWISVGGNDHDGSERWELLLPSSHVNRTTLGTPCPVGTSGPVVRQGDNHQSSSDDIPDDAYTVGYIEPDPDSCPDCLGTGLDFTHHAHHCLSCRDVDTDDCIDCMGTGRDENIEADECRTCNGTGYRGLFDVKLCPDCVGRSALVRKVDK